MYNNIDFDKLFDNESKYGKEYIQTSITEDRIKRAEQQVNHKLPNSYIEFIKLQNGGYIRNKECWLTAIYGIAEDEKSTNGLEEMYDTYIYEWNILNLLFRLEKHNQVDMLCTVLIILVLVQMENQEL